jgi:HlyD family secretion protein
MARKFHRPEAAMRYRLGIVVFVGIFLAGCSGGVGAAPTALPTVELDTTNAAAAAQTSTTLTGGVSASGVVTAAQQAQISPSTGGRVKSISCALGDSVKEGQALVTLEGSETLQAAVSAARLELDQAQQAVNDLENQADAARIAAMQQIVLYSQTVKDAQLTLDNFSIPNDQAGMTAVDAYNQMKKKLDDARTAFEPYRDAPLKDPSRERRKDTLDDAQGDYNMAIRRLKYEYNLEAAQTQLAQAQQDYEKVKSGPAADEKELADARLAHAQDQLAAAQASLDSLTIKAPFSGVVSRLDANMGEWAAPGQVMVVLADLTHLQVETTDLSERDIPQVKPGQTVKVQVKALNQSLTGKVMQVAPLADNLGGDVVYKTIIDLDTTPEGLLVGMSVVVQFE